MIIKVFNIYIYIYIYIYILLNFIDLKVCPIYENIHNAPFQVLNFRPNSIGESLGELTTELRRCEESTPHQYPRYRSKEHKNPTKQP